MRGSISVGIRLCKLDLVEMFFYFHNPNQTLYSSNKRVLSRRIFFVVKKVAYFEADFENFEDLNDDFP